MFNQLTPASDHNPRPVGLAKYEAQLRATPSYEIKAEYITLIGKCWDDLPRPKLESAIQALLQHRRGGTPTA